MRLITATWLLLLALPAMAGMAIVTSVPDLGDGGLLALSTAVGLASGWAIKRKKK